MKIALVHCVQKIYFVFLSFFDIFWSPKKIHVPMMLALVLESYGELRGVSYQNRKSKPWNLSSMKDNLELLITFEIEHQQHQVMDFWEGSKMSKKRNIFSEHNVPERFSSSYRPQISKIMTGSDSTWKNRPKTWFWKFYLTKIWKFRQHTFVFTYKTRKIWHIWCWFESILRCFEGENKK